MEQKQLCAGPLIYSCDVHVFPISQVERHSIDTKPSSLRELPPILPSIKVDKKESRQFSEF